MRNLTFFNFSDSNFSHPKLCSKINGEIVNFARLAAVSSEDYGSFKTSTFACRVPWIYNTFKLPDLTQHVLFGRQHVRRFPKHMVGSSQHALRPNTLHLPLSLINASLHKQVFLTAETIKSGGRSPMKHATNKT